MVKKPDSAKKETVSGKAKNPAGFGVRRISHAAPILAPPAGYHRIKTFCIGRWNHA